MNLALWLWQIQQGNHLGVSCKLEFVTVGNHQGNGAAEVTVQVIRQLGMCFLQRLEAGGGLDKPVFGVHHPLTAWCLVHASWIHNRYATTSGRTAYERAFDSPYQGTRKDLPVW